MLARRGFTTSSIFVILFLLLAGTANLATAKTLPLPKNNEQNGNFVRQGFADLVERVRPSVVNISTRTHPSSTFKNRERSDSVQSPQPGMPHDRSELDKLIQRFFGPGPYRQQNRATQSLGSGFIIAPEGLIVTNWHVINGADEINVVLDDGRTLPAILRGKDKKTDLAVLKIDAGAPLPYVRFGDSASARVGDWVIAIGNPFGLGGTTTSGIISARGRNIDSGPYDDYIQIDAPLNRGNSGGPLFNTAGEVIGVNSAIFSPTGGNVGIGFAIPAALASSIIRELRSTGEVRRGWLGVQIQPVTTAIAKSFQRNKAGGVLVSKVVPTSPAEDAGLKIGDIILRFNDIAVRRVRQLQRTVMQTKPGSSVELRVWRDAQIIALSTTITGMPGVALVTPPAKPGPYRLAQLGIELVAIDEETRGQFNIEVPQGGVVIGSVRPGSPAARNGLEAGDVILRVGKNIVRSPTEVATQIARAQADSRHAIVLLITRKGSNWYVPLNLV